MRSRVAGGRITGAKQCITNGSHAATFLVFARDAEHGPTALVVRAGARRLRRHARGGEDGLELLLTADVVVRGHARPAARGAGGGMRIAWPRSTAAGSGSPPRRSGSRGGARAATRYASERSASAVRSHAPGDPVQARGHADRDRGGARARLARGAPQAGRAPAHGRGRAGEAVRVRGRATPYRRGDPGLGGYGYTRSTRSSATTAMPASRDHEGTSEIQRLVIARALLGESMRDG